MKNTITSLAEYFTCIPVKSTISDSIADLKTYKLFSASLYILNINVLWADGVLKECCYKMS